jgi:hypothetical protein
MLPLALTDAADTAAAVIKITTSDVASGYYLSTSVDVATSDVTCCYYLSTSH